MVQTFSAFSEEREKLEDQRREETKGTQGKRIQPTYNLDLTGVLRPESVRKKGRREGSKVERLFRGKLFQLSYDRRTRKRSTSPPQGGSTVMNKIL